MILWILWQANGHLVFTVAKNVVGDNRLRLTPDNLETSLFLNHNLNYDMDSLESPPTNFRSPNSPHRDPRDSGEESGDESIAESADEDSEIEFSEDSDENLRPINLVHN